MQLRNLNQRYESTSKSRHHWLVFLNPLHRTFFQTDMSNKENASKEKVPGNGKKDRNHKPLGQIGHNVSSNIG